MHRASLNLHTCQRLRFGRSHSGISQSLSKTSPHYLFDEDGISRERLETWEHHHARRVKRRPPTSSNVRVGCLPTTLDIHRDENRAKVLRRINAPEDTLPYVRPLFLREDGTGTNTRKDTAGAQHNSKNAVNDHPIEQIQKGETVGLGLWPADSLQVQEVHRREKGKDRYIKKGDVLEYSGKPLPSTKFWTNHSASSSPLNRPWLAYMEKHSGSASERLTNEIRAYEAYMRLTAAEEVAAQFVMSNIRSIAWRSVGEVPLTLMGSRSTGLATPLSDFDLTFPSPSANPRPNKHRQYVQKAVATLRRVGEDLRDSTEVQDTKLVIAKTPIIDTKHCKTDLKIQIQTMGPFQPAQEYTAAYLNELPSLRPLFVVLRYSLEIRGLTTVREGGLGSYCLLMMIVNALKHSAGTFASDDLCGQLLYVLHFYGSANLYDHGYSANPPRVFEKINERRSISERQARSKNPQLRGIDQIVRTRDCQKPYLLCLQDPADEFNDLGKNSYAIKHVQAVFNEAHHEILKALESGIMPSSKYEADGPSSYLDSLVGADYKAFEKHRRKVAYFASNPSAEVFRYKDNGWRTLEKKNGRTTKASSHKARKHDTQNFEIRRILSDKPLDM